MLKTACVNPALSEYATPYCFGDATDEQREAFSAHLLECDYCWEEVQRLESAIRILRSDPDVTTAVAQPDVVQVLGLSGRLSTFGGGHLWPALTAIALYSLLYPLALVTEIAYEFDRLGRAVLIATPFTFLWMAATTSGALGLAWRGVSRAGRPHVFSSSTLLVAAPVALYLAVRGLLPARPVVQANFQTYTAQAGFLKSLILTAPFSIPFILIPFVAILMLQRQLQANRHAQVLDLITGEKHSVAPKGSYFLRPAMFGAGVATLLLFSVAGTVRLFEGLAVTNNMNLFMTVALVRSACYAVLWGGAFWWYTWALAELKRECVAMQSLGLDRSIRPPPSGD